MAVVRSAVLLSLAVCVESVSLAEDLGLLQGLQVSKQESARKSFSKASLIKTSAKLKQMVIRAQTSHAIPDDNTRSVMMEFKRILEEYRVELENQVAEANGQLESRFLAEVHNCSLDPNIFDTADVVSADAELNTTYHDWIRARNEYNDASSQEVNFLQNLGDEGPCGPAHDINASFFAKLEEFLSEQRPRYEDAVNRTRAASAAMEQARLRAESAQTTREETVCQLKKDAKRECHNYGECRRVKEQALDAEATRITSLASSFHSEAEVIEKSFCYVDLLLNMTENQVITDSQIQGCHDLTVPLTDFSLNDVRPDTTPMQPCMGYTDIMRMANCATSQEAYTGEEFQWATCVECQLPAGQPQISIGADDRISFQDGVEVGEEVVDEADDENVVPQVDENVVPQVDENVVPQVDENVVPQVDENVDPQVDENVDENVDRQQQ